MMHIFIGQMDIMHSEIINKYWKINHQIIISWVHGCITLKFDEKLIIHPDRDRIPTLLDWK